MIITRDADVPGARRLAGYGDTGSDIGSVIGGIGGGLLKAFTGTTGLFGGGGQQQPPTVVPKPFFSTTAGYVTLGVGGLMAFGLAMNMMKQAPPPYRGPPLQGYSRKRRSKRSRR